MSEGTVKRWNIQKGFGFIAPADGGGDVFVHQSALQMDGFRCLAEGAHVRYDVATDEDGRSRATAVMSPDGSKLKGLWGDEPHSVGKVARWRPDKGFGFIEPADGSADVFVHQSAIQAVGYRALTPGDVVEYSTGPDGPGGKPKANKVTAEGGRPIRAAQRPGAGPGAPPQGMPGAGAGAYPPGGFMGAPFGPGPYGAPAFYPPFAAPYDLSVASAVAAAAAAARDGHPDYYSAPTSPGSFGPGSPPAFPPPPPHFYPMPPPATALGGY